MKHRLGVEQKENCGAKRADFLQRAAAGYFCRGRGMQLPVAGFAKNNLVADGVVLVKALTW
jgi:hypothetical protein